MDVSKECMEEGQLIDKIPKRLNQKYSGLNSSIYVYSLTNPIKVRAEE